MGAIISIQGQEVALLCREVEARFLALRPDVSELRKTSFKGAYADLESCMLDALGGRDYPLSEGLLRKLFYDGFDRQAGRHVDQISFNRGFSGWLLSVFYRWRAQPYFLPEGAAQ